MKIILIYGLLAFSLNLNAADGTLFYIKGDVFVDGVKAKKSQKISLAQTIVVSKSSLAIVSMKNGSKLKVNENSSIKLIIMLLSRHEYDGRCRNGENNPYSLQHDS